MTHSKSSVHGVVPFGYLADKITLDPAEAALLREAAASIIEQNRSPLFWAKEFNRRGFVTRRGTPFSAGGLKSMLKRPRYAGVVVRYGVPTNEVAPWETLFDLDTWQALQARLSRPGIAGEVRPQSLYLATGIARCSVCNATMRGHMTAYEGRKYVCESRRPANRQPDGLRHPQIKVEQLDERIVAGVYATLREHGTDLTATESVSAINRKIGALHAAKKSALGLVRDPVHGLTLADAGPSMRGFEQQIEALEADRADALLQQALDKIDATAPVAFRASWDALTLEEQRRIVRRLLAVTVHNGVGTGRVQVEHRLP